MQNIDKPTSIYLRVDADEKLGLGHLSRCRSLMMAFSTLAECRFSIVSNNGKVVKNFIPNINFNLYSTDDCLGEQSFDVAIVDVPDIDNREKCPLKKFANLVVCVDDDGPGLHYQDILVRPNLLNCPKPPKIASENYWSGHNYIILHPDFMHQPQEKIRRNVKEILVCFGGSDPSGLTLRVIPILKGLDGEINIHLILGGAFQWHEEVLSALKGEFRFKLAYNIIGMADALSDSDLALISGGTLLYEACSLGVPSMVISQNESQDVEAAICHDAGAVINLGASEIVSDDKILLTLQQVLENASLRASMARKGKKFIPSDGVMRIARKLLTLVKGNSL